MLRFKLLILCMLPVLAFAPVAHAADADSLKKEIAGDKAIGNPAAPVTLIQYSSISCSHCVAFHNRVLPIIKKEYVDTGKLRYIFRDYPLNGIAFFASQVTHCAAQQGGDEKYFKVLNEIIANHIVWGQSSSARTDILLIAANQGIDGRQLTSCIESDKEVEAAILAKQKEAFNHLGIKKVPAFIINGEIVENVSTLDGMREALDSALAKAKQSPQSN